MPPPNRKTYQQVTHNQDGSAIMTRAALERRKAEDARLNDPLHKNFTRNVDAAVTARAQANAAAQRGQAGVEARTGRATATKTLLQPPERKVPGATLADPKAAKRLTTHGRR